jgi:hypothetical protein
LVAVGDGPVGEQGGKAFMAGFQHGFYPMDVEVGFLLTGKAGVGQIFGGGGRSHGHIQVAADVATFVGGFRCRRNRRFAGGIVAIAQPQVGAANGGLQLCWKRGVQHQVTGFFTSCPEIQHIVQIQLSEQSSRSCASSPAFSIK